MDTPAVYQCNTCRTIFGDSTLLDATVRTEYAMVLCITKNTTRSTEPKLEQPCYSVIFELSCSGCQTIIGKTYSSTPPNLDYLRGKFLLSLDRVLVYQFGEGVEEHRQISRDDLTVFTDGVNWERVDDEIAKLKSFCCVLHQSIQAIRPVKSE